MTTIPTPTTFDAAALRRAFADRDAGALSALYTDDATLEFVDADHSPSDPRRLQGREAIDAYAADLFARDMRHEVGDVAIGEETVGFSIRCAYQEGQRVVCIATGRLRDGRIATQLAA